MKTFFLLAMPFVAKTIHALPTPDGQDILLFPDQPSLEAAATPCQVYEVSSFVRRRLPYLFSVEQRKLLRHLYGDLRSKRWKGLCPFEVGLVRQVLSLP